MRAQICPLALFVAVLSLPGVAPAVAISISGRVTGTGEEPLKEARALLVPWVSAFEAGCLELEGKADPHPAAVAALSGDGSFRLDAPEAGMWKVVVQAPGFVPQEHPLLPLLDDTELPGVRLERDAKLEIRVSGPEGRPFAGVRVRIGDVLPMSFWFPVEGWRTPVRAGLADDRGVVVLPRGATEGLLVRAGAPGLAFLERTGVRASSLSLQLDAGGGSRKVRVVDSVGKPVSGALVRAGDAGWPTGRTSQDGILSIPIPRTGKITISALAENGGSARGVLARTLKPETVPRELRLLALQEVAGRVVSRADGRPVPRALVWADDPGLAQHTGGDGAYQLAVAPGLRLPIQAAAPGFFQGETIWLVSPDDRRGPTQALEPAFAATGMVVDEQGRPVEGVEVRAWSSRGGGSRSTSRTSSSGRFRLSTLAAGVGHALRLTKTGYAPGSAELPAVEPGRPAADLKIVLRKGRTAFGRVVGGPSEEGVVGARVVLHLTVSGDERLGSWEDPYEAVADATGRYEVRDLPPCVVELTARAAGFAPTTVPGLTVPDGAGATFLGTVVLVSGVALEGIVTGPGGRPLEGAVVEAAEEPGRSLAAAIRRETPPTVVTGGDGFFRIADRRTGETLRVTVRRAGYSIKYVTAVQVPREELLRIALEPSGTVEGRTVDANGRPVPGAQVLLLSRGLRKAVSGDDGAFRVEDVSPGAFELQTLATGWQPASLNVELHPGQDLQGLEVVLHPGSLVEGRVLAPGGRPLADALIRPADRTDRMSLETESARSDGDGYYRMHGVGPGTRTFTAEHSDYRKATRELEVKPGRSSLDFVLEGGVDVSGRVMDDAGLPVSGAQVILREGWRSWGRASAASGPDGSFSLQGVAEGAYRLAAEKQGYARDEEGQELTVGGDPVSGVEVRLSRGGSIVGQISGLDFPQLSRVQVRVDGSDNFARVSPDGSYRIDHVMPGELRVVATAGTRQAEGKIEMEPGAAEARLDLDFAEGLVLSGTLARNGEPLQNRSVTLSAPGLASRSSSTDHEGRFRFEGLEEGRYDLEVGWRGPGQHKETVALSRDMEVRINLVTVTLTGRVVDSADRSPLPGAEVLVEPEGGGEGYRVGTTDSKGKFRLSDVPEGSWQVRSLLAGYAPGEVRVEVDAGAPPDALEIPLQATEGVTLEVFLPSGRAPDDVRTAVLDPSGRVVASATYPVSDEGRLRIASVALGSWELLLDVDGAAPVSVSVRAPGHAGRVILPSAGGLSLTVPALRAARTGAKVSLTDAAGKPYRLVWGEVLSVFDLDDGYVKVDRLAAGTWKLAVTTDDGRTWTGTAVIIPGSTTEVALE